MYVPAIVNRVVLLWLSRDPKLSFLRQKIGFVMAVGFQNFLS